MTNELKTPVRGRQQKLKTRPFGKKMLERVIEKPKMANARTKSPLKIKPGIDRRVLDFGIKAEN